MNGTETGSATLAELCDLISEQAHPADVPEALYVGLEHVTPGRLRRSGGGIAADVQSHKYAFRRNDILYGKLRPYLDKAILADTDGVCTTELLVLRAKPGVDPRFLACLVHDPDFVEHALTGVTGAHHPRTSWAHIAQFECPRFSYEEQQAIAALLWRIQDLLKVCEDTLEVAQDLKRAAMRELFTRGLRGEPQKDTEIGLVPESWDVTTLGVLCDRNGGRIQTGPFGSQLHANEYEADGVPVINPTHLEGNRISHSEVPRVSIETAARLTRHKVEPGDILFGRRGEIGRHGLVSNAETGWLCGTGCFVVRVRHPGLDNAFLSYLFSTESTVSWLVAHAAGTIMPNLNNVVLSQLPVIYPRLDEQHDIVAILDAIDRKIELHRKKRAVLEDLFKALLHKLMTGEIRVDELDLSALQAHAEPLSPAAEPAV